MIKKFLNNLCEKIVIKQLDNIKYGNLILVLPNKKQYKFGNKNENENYIYVKNNDFFKEIVFKGNIGLGESYMKNDWETPNLTSLLTLLINNMKYLQKSGINKGSIMRIFNIVNHNLNNNTRKQSIKNIHSHYDLGNDFYKLFLDNETMMYSSAIFKNNDEKLYQAQINKLNTLISLGELNSSDHILEIGSGWGGFAIQAAKTIGCKITTITISKEQFIFTKQKILDENVDHLVDIKLCDYRDISGSYDKIVSIEMLEAVGQKYYGTFFNKCNNLLKPNGKLILQVITIPDQRFQSYKKNPDWIQKHIFPGGILPSLYELTKAIKNSSELQVDQINNIGIHYAKTLHQWRFNFNQNKTSILSLGFNEIFLRKWNYYLSYCEAGFASKFINNLHIVIKKLN
ncbi:MAG: cyclopropane-fatty-acyl-phospholipid synthase family protein [Verrucomicrobiota bacterium]|nr:cyclopropane-fatty-acyl-phospholipid synthase family protein [Verrucomicrobiota bacterium]